MKTVQTMKGHSNYQDCSALRPHVPHSSYGTYVTLAPKVLVFPVFVQVSLWNAPPRIQGPLGDMKIAYYSGDL